MNGSATRLDLADLPLEGWDDPLRGRIAWKTLFSADRTPTDSLTCGVVLLGPGGSLALHRHAPAEVYFGIEGNARVTIEGVEHTLGPGVALFIPGNALHSVAAGAGSARFFYVFAQDSFAKIEYDFPTDPAAR